MPRPTRTDVSESEVLAFLAQCRYDIAPLALRSGVVVPPPTPDAVRDLLSKIDHSERYGMFHRASLHHLDSSGWRGKSCGRHPRHGQVYVRRLLFHWLIAPLSPHEELIASPCGCANPFHSVLRPTHDHTDATTQRYVKTLVMTGAEKQQWAHLLSVRCVSLTIRFVHDCY